MTIIEVPGVSGLTAKRYRQPAAIKLAEKVREVYEKSYIKAIESGRLFAEVDSFMERYASYSSNPEIDLVIVYLSGEPIAQTWGWPLSGESMWWTGLVAEPEPGFTVENGRRTFALSEIMVSHQWSGRGIAHALQDFLLAGRDENRATLLVNPENEVARRAYERWGWRRVSQLLPKWPDAPLFDVMMREL